MMRISNFLGLLLWIAEAFAVHGNFRHAHLHDKHRSASSTTSVTTQPTSPAPGKHVLTRRAPENDDYTCGPNKPCKNKACCGKNNVCGFGDLYCGNGCQSHCDAKAECGRDAATPGQTCPLNICCSEFGFCGTTSEFCGSGCQSNCKDPNRPSGGSTSDVRNKIIGYYESWRAVGQKCGMMTPEEIPVEYLDQVNMAFVYIDPDDYHIIAMDDEPFATDLYKRVANIKTRNPSAEVWVSVGGWTFNDPGTYQSVFSTIASDEDKTNQFAGHLMEFMDKYGFDGVDLDWEYPGADDRGGKDEDVKNYVSMMKILKKNLKSGNDYSKKWGISITVPTSYWYLRWFDIEGLESQIDTFNLMAYDLHGTWDSDDPIGPYVYAHTNLTEIEMALDLFWRSDINPSKIVLGLAFYGRTYELSTPLCATSGCEWKNPGPKGKCTGTAGILSYSEIKDIISDSNINPTYDEDAGVYYMTYGKGGANWASFDDAVSFQAKIELANYFGLGGVLVWAIDQDDKFYNALRGVTGKDVEPAIDPQEGYGAFTLDQCYITNCGESCTKGDVLMTKLNEDESGRGCSGKDHNARSFCCPAVNAPDSSDCYWTGGPVNCHGQCAAGEVTMVLDDWGDSKKRCTNGGKKAWCCPATNGQKAIQECELATPNKDCPSDKPQEMTSVYWSADIGLGYEFSYEQKFCCPEKPAYDSDKCGWHGENHYCNDSECPVGQVELFRWHGSHSGPPKSAKGCNKGRQQAFCCPPPLSDGSAFLPVPLENLFPTGDSFSDSVTTTFSEAFDQNSDETSFGVSGTDPNKKAFAWTIIVGEEEDVQSFVKRDGSHLELFECPDTHEDDFDVQKAKAVCVGGSEENNNCEDILKGGVEGTVVRLPAHCGPDDWVRAVRFERSMNQTLPGHLQKRHPSARNVYDFHYDYNFQQLRRDGGEVYFRTDFSTHPGYWDEVVAASHDSSLTKRSSENWRELDRRFWAENDKESWLKRFNDLLTQGDTGLKKHYEFNQCLFQSEAKCANAEADTSAFLYGELNTTMDFGTTLIGKLRNFQFTEAFSFFNQEGFSMRAGAGIRAQARLYFDSGWHSIGEFDAFGMDLNLKGIFSIKPYFAVDARVEADAYLSTQATVEMKISHDRFRYYLPAGLGSNPTQVTGSYNLDTTTGPISGFGNIDARAGGGVVFGFKPRIAMDIDLQFRGSQYVNTSVELSTPGSIRIDAALATGCSNGMQFDVTGQMDVDFAVKNGLPGWSSKSYTFKDNPAKKIYSGCVPFSVLAKRELEAGNGPELTSRSTTGSDLTLPKQSNDLCAFSTKGIYCADPDDNDDPSPNCDLNDLSYLNDSDDDGDATLTRRGHLEKRSKKELDYCYGKTEAEGLGYQGFGTGSASYSTIHFSDYPSSTELVEDYDSNAPTYDNADPQDCNNFDLVKLDKTPQKPYPSKEEKKKGVREYHSEHVLEAQTVQRFFNALGMAWSNLKKGPQNPNAKLYQTPRKGETDAIPWCTYMKLWWNLRRNDNANNMLGSVYPGYDGHYTDELVLYESALNSKVKQGWFSGNQLTGASKIDKQIDKGEWSEVAKTLKLHIVAWKYYYVDEIKNTLVKQADRVEDALRELEGTGEHSIHAKVGNNDGDYDNDYIPQNLAAHWRSWVQEEHERVQLEVKRFLNKYAKKAYDLNRPEPDDDDDTMIDPGQAIQKNADIVKIFETALSEVQKLETWTIPWDGDSMDTSD